MFQTFLKTMRADCRTILIIGCLFQSMQSVKICNTINFNYKNESSMTVTITNNSKINVEFTSANRSDGTGIINRRVYPRKGYVNFPDVGNSHWFWFYPHRLILYWDQDGGDNFWSVVSRSDCIVDVKNAEVLINTRAKLSCVITGVIRVDEVRWEKPNSGGVIDHGTDGYEIDKGSFNSETNSHTTVLTVPADKNTADSVYTCVIRNEKDHVEYENYVILDVFTITTFNRVVLQNSYISIANSEIMTCKIGDLKQAVRVTWEDHNYITITNDTEGYIINHYTAIETANVHTSTLTISAAMLKTIAKNGGLATDWVCKVQSIRFPQSRIARKKAILEFSIIVPTISSFIVENKQLLSHTEKQGLLTVKYERQTSDESGGRNNKSHHATVCVENFDFDVADYICQSLQYNFCRQWGRSGDTNRVRDRKQREFLDEQEYMTLKCHYQKEGKYLYCDVNDTSCNHEDDIRLSCDDEPIPICNTINFNYLYDASRTKTITITDNSKINVKFTSANRTDGTGIINRSVYPRTGHVDFHDVGARHFFWFYPDRLILYWDQDHGNSFWSVVSRSDCLGVDTERWRDDGKCGADYPLRTEEPSECNPTGDKPCCNKRLKDCGSTKEYCACDECLDFRSIGNNDCELSNVGGFLKYKCYNQKRQDHFRCARSDNDTRYKPTLKTWVDSRGVFMITNTSEVCENDPYAYQACGFGTLITIEPTLCGGTFSLDKQYNETETPQSVSSGECDGKCDWDSTTCSDESDCKGYFYGLNCNSSGEVIYAPVHWICNSITGCDDDLDEKDCEPSSDNCTHYFAKMILKKDIIVPINNFTRCAAFDIKKEIYPYCIDFKDQTNCTDESRIGGICKLENETTHISSSMVCYNYKMNQAVDNFCDDGSESFCETVLSDSEECIIHKHRMCDNSSDCHDGSDEHNDNCKMMTKDFSCARKFGRYQEIDIIPLSWLLDEQEDCINGEDENTQRWEQCLPESSQASYVIPKEVDTGCKDVFICNSTSSTSLIVRLEIMCDGVESCGKDNQVENEVCRYSRDFPDLQKIAPTTREITDLCTDVIDTSIHGQNCELLEFSRKDKVKTFGVKKLLNIPNIKVNCKDKFGEFYVYLSCMDRCENSSCPIGDTPLKHDACPGQYPDRIYTLAGEKSLTFVTKSNMQNNYENDYFQCENERCIEYSQVCDLTNDCGDWSDEENCTNSFHCENERNRISWQQQCDGIVDCADFSDECNDECNKRILENSSLAIILWIMGVFATIFNLILITRSVYSFKSIKTGNMLETRLLIITIALGDLLNGIYLTVIAFFDTFIYGSSYCKSQAEWLSSRKCSVLGIISTIGSQTSLFAMTVLSITRFLGLARASLKPPSPVNKKAIIKSSVKVSLILASSAAIALIPLVPSLEDYFVEGIYYESENDVFMGFPNKEKHVNVLKAYYDKQPNISYDMPWREIHRHISEMFTNEHETMSWRKVHYYGNDGLCLFKFFVRTDDARRSRQSFQEKTGVLDYIDFEGNGLLWSLLAVNFVCFLVMSISYVRITIQTWKSSSVSGQNSNLENVRRKERIELKISLIIVTDFLCWIPFIIVCALHNFQFIDATDWYVYFAMVLLPVNSVLNPLLYDDTITGFLVTTNKTVKTRLSTTASMIYSGASRIFPPLTKREAIPLEDLEGSNAEGGSSVNMTTS